MQGKQTERKRKANVKALVITEIIVCYMAFLAVVSYARGPQRIQPEETALMTGEDFFSFSGEKAQPGDGLWIEDPQNGEAAGYLAEIDLDGIDWLMVSFQIDCPENDAGGTLFVDLCNPDESYDNPEQEATLRLQAGPNQASFCLGVGAEHPKRANLRVFTLDAAGYRVDDLRVCRGNPLPSVPIGLRIGACMCFLLLAVTVAAGSVNKQRQARREEKRS